MFYSTDIAQTKKKINRYKNQLSGEKVTIVNKCIYGNKPIGINKIFLF